MIKIRKKDTIVDIVQKINDSSEKEVVLDFPLWHPVLHNYLSLKILKNKSLKKKLIILTSDLTSRKIWKNLGIKYSIIKDKDFIEETSKNKDLMKYNFTFIEYFNFEIKQLYTNFWAKLARNKKINSINKYYNKYNKSYHISWFLLWLALSLFLLVFIFYFAVNKTHIHITPEIIVKTRAKNFVFKEQETLINTNNDISELINISKNTNLSRKFTTTWVDLQSIKRARWVATYFNETLEEQQILSGTTAKTQDWILFKTQSWAILPPATKDNFWNIIPSTQDVEIEADIYDINWKFTWSKWNISKETSLVIPWLKSFAKSIYLITSTDLSWWEDKYEQILSETDLNNAKLIMEEKLKSTAIKELNTLVKENNQIDKTDMEIFWIDDMITYSDINIQIEDDISIWDNIETFSLNGSINISTYIYNKTNIVNRLKNVIRDSILDGTERVVYIDNNSLRISNVIYKIDAPLEIKATAEIETLISHDFLGEDNNYVDRLKNTIRWIDKRESIKLLLNDPKISNVDIKIRPFFMNNISNINENIVLKVIE